MSEYQCYDVLAVDWPLDDRPQGVRWLSIRARIAATSVVNEHNWVDFRGNPNRVMVPPKSALHPGTKFGVNITNYGRTVAATRVLSPQ
jgi:hypothetical protein